MKIAVMPDMPMMVVNLIEKNGHEYLSATNITKEDLEKREAKEDNDAAIDYDKPPFNMEGYDIHNAIRYTPFDAPSGVKGRLMLFDNVIENAEAAIIINKNPDKNGEVKMYDGLNELILFSCISCNNAYGLIVHNLREKKIPRLEVMKPRNRGELIDFINTINNFLKNADSMSNDTVIDKRILHEDEIFIQMQDINR